MQDSCFLGYLDDHSPVDAALASLLEEQEIPAADWLSTRISGDSQLGDQAKQQGASQVHMDNTLAQPAPGPCMGPQGGALPCATADSSESSPFKPGYIGTGYLVTTGQLFQQRASQMEGCLSSVQAISKDIQADSQTQPSLDSDISPGATSVFQSWGQQLHGDPSVRITISRQDNPPGQMAAEMLPRPRELSESPSDSMDVWHYNLPGSKADFVSTMPSVSQGAPLGSASMSVSTEMDATQMVLPVVQTGIQAAAAAPSATPKGGRRVLRTPEERKAHRMAKNRATAAASRKRKQAVKDELLNKQEFLERENARLAGLLLSRESEIAKMRKQIQAAGTRKAATRADEMQACSM